MIDDDDAKYLEKKVTQNVVLYEQEENRCAAEPTDMHAINSKQCEI